MDLNDQQCIAILTEGLNRNLYANQGKVPDDPKVRLKDATDLVQAAEAANRNGNKSENVECILFIAKVDQKPLPVINIEPTTTPAESAPKEQSGFHNGLDLSTLSDAVIDGLITGLDKYPPSDQVEVDRKAYTAEKERRGNAAAQKGQEIPQAEAPEEANKKAGEISTEGSGSMDESIPQTNEPMPADRGREIANGENSTADSAQGEDAGAFARAQTPETSSEKGRKAKAKPIEEDGERAALESQLTLPIVKAHGIDVTKIGDLTLEQLLLIVENPEGLKEKSKMSISEQEIEEGVVQTNTNIGGKNTVGFVEKEPIERVISKADLGLEVSEKENYGSISAEREKLESLITGPILKVYGRGRKEIPGIGDNELRFMILNSDGKVQPEDLQKAQEKDIDIPVKISEMVGRTEGSQKSPEMVVTKEVLGPEKVSKFIEPAVPVAPERTTVEMSLTEVTLPSGQKVMVTIPEQVEITANITEEKDRTVAEAARESIEQNNIEKQEIEQENKVPEQNRAMEIISREGMPIPPQYKDEEAPILPMDVSAISRDELFSLHAKFHACESRMLWIMCQEEDTLGDIEKLRKNREAVVAAEVPFMGEDGKRNTNEYRDAQVAADSEVLELGIQEHEIKKVVKRLKVLCDSYHRSCERMSRQMSKYERERSDAPR